MAKNIIIFEGPGKKTTAMKYKNEIEKKIGGPISFEATGGHLLSTDPETLDIGIDIDNKDISVNMKVYDSAKKKSLQDLGNKIKECIDSKGMIYLFTDSDRAGEMIAREVVNHFKLKKGQFLRKGIASMEKDDFLKYFDETGEWYNENMADSDQSRMILDKLWGYIKSPHLWNKISKDGKRVIEESKKTLEDNLKNFKKENPAILNEKRIKEFEEVVNELIEEVGSYSDESKFKELFKSSIGRVQIPMLRLVADAFLDSFKKVKLSNSLRILDENSLHWSVNNIKKSDSENDSEETGDIDVDAVYSDIKECKSVIVNTVITKSKRMSPPTPYNDSSLQSDGTKLLGLSPEEIGEIGQKLYEQGIVTYYRSAYTGYTDGSVKVLSQMVKEAGNKLIMRNYPLEEGAGHDAIHATYKGDIVKVGEYYMPDIWENNRVEINWIKFFDMVYRRSLSGFMEDVEFEESIILGTANGHSFKLIVNKITNLGFSDKYYWSLGNIRNTIDSVLINKYVQGQLIGVSEVKLEKGKFKFSSKVPYDTFRNKLDNYSISTSATFLPILKVITTNKGYAIESSNKKDKYIDITAKGWIIYNLVKDYDVFNLETTEKLEKYLSKIEKGKAKTKDTLFEIFKEQFLDNGYYEFYTGWCNKKSSGGSAKVDDKKYTDEICDKCKKGRIYIMDGVSKTSGKPYKMAKCENEKNVNKNGKWINSGCPGPTNKWR